LKRDTAWAVFLTFLRAGLTSFGGPTAHLGFFRRELVGNRAWLSEHAYAELVALCQFLPGPGSTQVGFAIGLHRAGLLGGFAAWLGFTLPSALILFAIGSGVGELTGPAARGFVQGLPVVALPVVAQAVWTMGRILSPDPARLVIASAAAVVALASQGIAGQMIALAMGAAAGMFIARNGTGETASALRFPIGNIHSAVSLAIFASVLIGLQLGSSRTSIAALDVGNAFYRAGALVFGGGHVVLPLLEPALVGPGWMAKDDFLAGYAAAQAVPGPIFSIAAYAGARMDVAPGGAPLALWCLVLLFLPGLLLVAGIVPVWTRLRNRRLARSAVRGVNAAVVGILAAALYDPVWVGAIHRPFDLGLAVAAFGVLRRWPDSPWLAVLFCGVAGALVPRP
jgi:chromate transporter